MVPHLSICVCEVAMVTEIMQVLNYFSFRDSFAVVYILFVEGKSNLRFTQLQVTKSFLNENKHM